MTTALFAVSICAVCGGLIFWSFRRTAHTLAHLGDTATVTAGPTFDWNVGAWFGALVGVTAWMPRLAYTLHHTGHTTASAILSVAFVACLLTATTLWIRREAIPFAAAGIGMLSLVVIVGVLAIALCNQLGLTQFRNELVGLEALLLGFIGVLLTARKTRGGR